MSPFTVVSRNSIATECADFQSVLSLISDQAYAFRENENPPVNVLRLMVMALEGTSDSAILKK